MEWQEFMQSLGKKTYANLLKISCQLNNVVVAIKSLTDIFLQKGLKILFLHYAKQTQSKTSKISGKITF
jgi:hypothetical protein